MIPNDDWPRKRVENLGRRLVAAEVPVEQDIEMLHRLLLTYDVTLTEVAARIEQETGIQPTSRLKNTGTILEKLRRHGGHSLRTIQDLAGARIVADLDLFEQDDLVRTLANLFDEPSKVVDRRVDPRQGYRAVHLIVRIGRIPVEVQIRTSLQHEWANMFEKLADVVGRGIRYSEPPDDWFYGVRPQIGEVIRRVQDPQVSKWFESTDAIIANAIDAALRLSDVIHAYEAVRSLGRNPEVLSQLPAELSDYARTTTSDLEQIRTTLDGSFESYREIISRLVARRSLATRIYQTVMDTFARKYQDTLEKVLNEIAPDSGTILAPPETEETVLREILKIALKPTLASSGEEGNVES